MTKTSSYILSAYDFIFTYPIDKLLDVGYKLKNGNPIPSFDENLLNDLCLEAQNIFANENNVLEIEGDLIIVGDIHGSFHDLLRILSYIQQNDKKVLFLGDYVDRGNFSLECITILFALKVEHPDKYFLIRGNHEFDTLCSQYGFKDEILNHHNPKKPQITSAQETPKKGASDIKFDISQNEYMSDHNDAGCYKYTENLYNSFIKAFSYLPICAIVNKTTFCIHGGLSPKLEKISYIERLITRPINLFEENQILCDVVWGDPSSNSKSSFDENPRGRGYLFNVNSVMFFLLKNSIKRIIRGHECVKKGSFSNFNGKCITVFSASSYDKNMKNYSAILELFQKNDKMHFITFSPIDRLQKSDTVYYRVEPLNKTDEKIPCCFSFHNPKLESLSRGVKYQKTHGFLALQCKSSRTSLLAKPSLQGSPNKTKVLNYSLGDLKAITRSRSGFNSTDLFT